MLQTLPTIARIGYNFVVEDVNQFFKDKQKQAAERKEQEADKKHKHKQAKMVVQRYQEQKAVLNNQSSKQRTK
jgi:hypothetical protein